VSRVSATGAVVTGMGVVAPGGIGINAFWDMMTAGRTATRPISLFDPTGFRCQVSAEVDFEPAAHGLSPQETRRLDRATQMALVAAREAMVDSGLSDAPPDPARTAVSLGNAVGNTIRMEQEYVVISDGGRQWLTDWRYSVPFSYDYMLNSTMASELARAVGSEGPVNLISTGCTSGLDAIGNALNLIEEGTADVVVAGATDAPISPITVACFDALRATTPNTDDPARACRPFDLNRDGIVLGEGAAILILESAEHARRRGANILARITGYANRANAFHMTGLKPDGRELAEAIRVALHRAKINPQDVDYVNAHGSGTRQNDWHETAAIKDSLGEHAYKVPVSSIKSMIGHSLGAIGSIEIVACVQAIRHGVVPPTANLETVDPRCDLDCVPTTARDHDVRVAISTGSGFGGFQSVVVVTAPEKGNRS
jgi:act minimal PKS ketosynthase (KS/KS alpha)